ncbi:hypothetical protein M406DRAFT_328686 [Cryphonectria parasitica EP155]|uniref:Uncharacterized protein n=1 Tax=Cryphonectria parasitica (strain ATCC 38755 / EP155) TaxID=660469 RepID=A0A9P5CRZ3_CRYP1|nr:uncharacterized protein M406DRAFT_328686 [Cryphonectria parasitica EP155]KAF3767615.1 hypothetical protein M406DRAFT_328686 [Cryphonectria parasitica EP155]
MAEYEYHSPQKLMTPEESCMDTWDGAVMNEVMQYAYENNLVIDHRLSSFSIAHLFGPLIQETIPDAGEDGFTDHSHLAELEIPTPSLWEKPSTTNDALRLIHNVRRSLTDEEVEKLTQEVCDSVKVAGLKLELPILKTDNEWDMKEFEKENAARRAAVLDSIKNHRLPLHPQNLEDGEGMELSAKVRARCDDLVRTIEGERLAVTQDSARYLINQRRHEFTSEDRMRFLIEENPRMEKKLTPPVSPKLRNNFLTSDFDPGPLPIPPDSSSLLSDNFHAIEEAMLGEHQDRWSDNTSPIREFLQDKFTVTDQEAEALLDYPRQNLDEFKIEMPLLMDEAPELPGPSGPGAFKDFVEGAMDLDRGSETAWLQSFSDDSLQEQLQKAAGKIEKAIEQEELNEVDATARVRVPIMDFSRPDPEWARLHNDARGIFQWMQGGMEHLFEIRRWPVHKTAESKLRWNPLNSHKANFALFEETVDAGDPLVQALLQLPETSEVSTSLDFVQQRNLPMAFKDQDIYEEIEVEAKSKSAPEDNLMDFVRKRSINLNDRGETFKKPRTFAVPSSQQMSKNDGPSLLAGDSPGASTRLLENYMEIHAPEKKPWTYMSKKVPRPNGDRGDQSDSSANKPATKQNTPCPSLQLPGTPLAAFISVKIPARLLWAIEGLIPDLTLIERDYDGHNTSVWRQGSVARAEVVPDLANDADVSISPSTGLIITSMIRVRQKSKPGTTKSMVQIRVEKASVRYEQLIVLIGGEGGGDDTLTELSTSDMVAIHELQGFSSGLDCSVQIHYVGGGDKTLATWVASCISRYGLADPAVLTGLLDAETLWELFLRRAGFNVFAAQVVVGQLKLLSPGANRGDLTQYGLGAFVTMTRAERMHRFGQLVGTRVLERVSRAIDESWNLWGGGVAMSDSG